VTAAGAPPDPACPVLALPLVAPLTPKLQSPSACRIVGVLGRQSKLKLVTGSTGERHYVYTYYVQKNTPNPAPWTPCCAALERFLMPVFAQMQADFFCHGLGLLGYGGVRECGIQSLHRRPLVACQWYSQQASVRLSASHPSSNLFPHPPPSASLHPSIPLRIDRLSTRCQ
jgi:hypothetical protein